MSKYSFSVIGFKPSYILSMKLEETAAGNLSAIGASLFAL